MADETELEKTAVGSIGRMPIYLDRVRKIADVATGLHPEAWKPANAPAQKLFCCIECLRDLDDLMQTTGRVKNKAKRRRKLKLLHTPLHSLVESIGDLANDLENNPDTVGMLPENARPLIPQLRAQLLRISTVEKGGLLSTTRNKISAHMDRALSAEEMQTLLNQADSSRIGLWLHTSVTVLADFIKLPVYFWSCEPDGKDILRIMFKEPLVVTLGLDSCGKPLRIIEIRLIPKPPRYELFKLLKRVVKNSAWMFEKGATRISEFVTDNPSDTWAKSLKWLPHLSALPVKKEPPSVVKRVSADDGRYLIVPANVPFLIKSGIHRIARPEDLTW